MQLIDLHTHHAGSGDSLSIRNVFAQDLAFGPPDFLFSSGLHPWHIGQVDPAKCFQNLEENCSLKNLLAIGECGLDRLIKTDFALQKDIFKIQATLAERHNKPLIIHCVRAYPDLIQIKKAFKPEIPWIIHGFRGNMDSCLSLIKQGFYFSVGEKLLKDESKSGVFRSIPANRLFLETDDSETLIREIHLLAAQILKIDESALAEKIASNFQKLFGDADGLLRLTII